MKYSPLLLCAVLFSCSSGSNDLMTRLVNEKKSIQDSINYATANEAEYLRKARASMRDPDTTIWQKFADTSSRYSIMAIKAEKRSKEIEFSIDSLSKMK